MPPTAAGSEHAEQSRFFAYLSRINHPATRTTFAVPNGFLRTKAMRLRAWREGVRAGVPDVCCAYPVHPHPGLWLEFKVGKNTASKDQRAFMDELRRLGHRVELVRSGEEAFRVWADYLGFDIVLSGA